jgi:NAD(P)-dependent dehydrogenase (short-subunit alcohol dehydrogenase family)
MSATWLTEQFGLEGKVALVTGASGDLGFAIAKALGAAGAVVALHGTTPERVEKRKVELEGMGIEVRGFVRDLLDPLSASALVTEVVQHFGQLDILVNCAGINRRKPVLDVTAEDYEAIMELNLRACFQLSQAAGRVMVPRRTGKIINIGSLTNTLGLAGIGIYGMAKAGLGQLTRTLAVEWGPDNVQANCIIPGFFRTGMTEEVWRDPRRVEWLAGHIPMKRGGLADELSGLAVFLSSPASSYVSGQSIAVDGGVLAGAPGYGPSGVN